MKRIVLVALAIWLSLYAVPATADGPTVDLTAAFPSSPTPVTPQIERMDGHVVIVDGARSVVVQPSRIVRVNRLLDGTAQRLADGYLVEAVTSGDSETNAGDFLIVNAHGDVTRFLIHGGPAKDADTAITPAISRDGRYIAWVDGPINGTNLIRTRNRLNVFSVVENRFTHVRSFGTGGWYAVGVAKRKVLWASRTRLYTWTFRTGRTTSVPAAMAGRYDAPSPTQVSANLKASIVGTGRGCQAVLDLATGRLSDRTCSSQLWALSADARLVLASDREKQDRNGTIIGPRHAWLRDRAGTAVVTYDAGSGNVVYPQQFVSRATVLLAVGLTAPDGTGVNRDLACTLTACEVVPAS